MEQHRVHIIQKVHLKSNRNRVALQEVWAQIFSDHPEKQSAKGHEASSKPNMCAEVLYELCIHFLLCCFTTLVTLKHNIWNKITVQWKLSLFF